MDFNFTDEQTMLRDTVSRTLQKSYDFERRKAIVASGRGRSPEVWQQLAALGLTALPFPEDIGGLGGAISDVVAVAELFGEHLVIEPYLSSIVMAGNAMARANQAAAGAWLERIMSGEALAAFAHEEGKGTADAARIALPARRSGEGYRLTGEKRHVLGAGEADVLVVTVRTDGAPGEPGGLALMLVDPRQAGVTVTAFQTVDGRSAAHLRFDDVEVKPEAVLATEAAGVIEAVVQDAIIALSAEAVGAMGALIARTAEYAGTRKQFGVPIASFQAVAHRLADMKIAGAKARATLLYTTALAEAGRAGQRDLTILKGQVGVLGTAIGEAAVQTHGGIGMTDEMAIGHYLKRLLAIDGLFGASDYHFRRLGMGFAAA